MSARRFEQICYFIILSLLESNLSVIYYVDPRVSMSGDGTQWTEAYKTFDEAIISATNNDQIWLVGDQTYYPNTIDRNDCFQIAKGVLIYGGFDGTESTISERPNDHKTIISGDINTKDTNTDNCYHVLTYSEQLSIDTITISDGYADLQIYTDSTNALDKYGAAIITSDPNRGTQLLLDNVKFTNNWALNGGALWFMANDLLETEVNAMITNCIFTNNYAIDGDYEGGYGGAIYMYFYANVTVQNTQFIENSAKYRGGAIYQDYGGIFSCEDCIFESNTASDGYGGAIFSEDRNSQTEGTFPMISDSTFTTNFAKLCGGAICWFNDVKGELQNNIFDGNTADISGGAIALVRSSITTNVGNTFMNNVANDGTNDYYNETRNDFEQIDHSLTFDINAYLTEISDTFDKLVTAGDSAYDYLDFVYSDKCFVEGTNNANADGSSWDKGFEDIQQCLDQLSSTGGEIWVKTGTYKPTVIPQWKLDQNRTAVAQRSFVLYDNVTMFAGFDGTETMLSERDFVNNPTILSCELNAAANRYCNQLLMAADHCIIDGFVFEDSQNNVVSERRRLQASGGGNSISIEDVLSANSVIVGGGIYTNSTNIKVTNSIFHKLFSNGKGGAVYCIGLEADNGFECDNPIKSPTFVNIAFLGNRAGSRGGAIAADVNCHFTCDYCIFESNSCSLKGGAVYLDFDCDPKISNSEYRNNYALESGGALAADGASYVSFDGVMKFINNYADWEGGALYSGSGVGPGKDQGFTFFNNSFDNNRTSFSGNHLKYDDSGQDNIYLWPYSTLNMIIEPDTPAPTFPPTPMTPSPTDFVYDQTSPNIILFIIDDMLYTKSMESMAPDPNLDNTVIEYLDIPTPNINKLRSEGITIPRSYSAAPKCSPARFSILTGRYVSRSTWAIERTLATTNGFLGTNITIETSKLQDSTDPYDGMYNIPYQLQNKATNAYRTGHVGKWHLMTGDDNGFDYGCSSLNSAPNATLYELCVNVVKQLGFDFVDAFYHSNIGDHAQYGHNPEWIISSAQKFITDSVEDNQPFFLNMMHTLTHTPDADLSLENRNIYDTPKGVLPQDCLPTDTNMTARCEILAGSMNLGHLNDNEKSTAAGYLWVDDSLGALITYLKGLGRGIYDNTFIVVTNDHGQGSKGTIYEQGARVFQFIRFPELFEANITLNDNFITSVIDLAEIIFNITDTVVDNSYILDSKSWVNDANDFVNFGSDEAYVPECCECRFFEVFNSRALVTPQWKYIFRQTSQVESDIDVTQYYPHGLDEEQLYNLQTDPGEQNNQINNASLLDIICSLQSKMINFINDTCPVSDPCQQPTLLCTTDPSTAPTKSPTTNLSQSPSKYPTKYPTKFPTKYPTQFPTKYPTATPTQLTSVPTKAPANNPTAKPSKSPLTDDPTNNPSSIPSSSPSKFPTLTPSVQPSLSPSQNPTKNPSLYPTENPSLNPTKNPALNPTKNPSLNPSPQPTAVPTFNPTAIFSESNEFAAIFESDESMEFGEAKSSQTDQMNIVLNMFKYVLLWIFFVVFSLINIYVLSRKQHLLQSQQDQSIFRV